MVCTTCILYGIAKIVFKPRPLARPMPMTAKYLKTAVMLSRLAYTPHEKIDKACQEIAVNPPVTYVESEIADAQAYVWKIDKDVFVAYRGTESMKDAAADLDVRYIHLKDGICVHRGFFNQLMSIKTELLVTLRDPDILSSSEGALVFCGHSLGGALATLSGPLLAEALDESKQCPPNVCCFTFGCPRVGNGRFVDWFGDWVTRNLRVANEQDPVPMIPISNRYEHVRDGICMRDDGRVEVVRADIPWYLRPLYSITTIDVFRPIKDHECKLYVQRIEDWLSPIKQTEIIKTDKETSDNNRA